MNKLSYFILSIICLAFITSCSKDDSTPATPSSLLQSGTWKLKSIKAAGIEFAQACDLDNTLKFSATSAVYDYGSNQCDPADPKTETTSYTLSADGKTITVDGEDSKVNTLTSSSLVLESTDSGITTLVSFGK